MKALLQDKYFWLIIAAGFAVRIITIAAVPFEHVHPWDYGLFWHWGRMLYNDGISAGFYLSEAHTDYMPGYMYVLWLKAAIESAFELARGGFIHRFVFALPAILADVAIGGLIYRWVSNTTELRSVKPGAGQVVNTAAILVSLLWMLNPAVILISTAWGQIDSILAFILLLSVYWLTKKKFLAAFLLYSVGIIVKQQAIVMGPLFLFFLVMFLLENKWSGKAFLQILRNGVICVAVLFVIILPFTFYDGGFNIVPVAEQFMATLDQRHFATVNAYNVWGALGLNWYPTVGDIPQNTFFFTPPQMALRVLGYGLGIGGAVFVGFWLLIRNRSKQNYFFAGAMIFATFFMFSVRMHDRYAFVAMPFLLAAYVFSGENNKFGKRDIRYLVGYIGFSVASFLNYFVVLQHSLGVARQELSWWGADVIREATIYSWPSVLVFAWLVYLVVTVKKDESNVRSV